MSEIEPATDEEIEQFCKHDPCDDWTQETVECLIARIATEQATGFATSAELERALTTLAAERAKAAALWSALDQAKRGAEYVDELGDIIDRALTTDGAALAVAIEAVLDADYCTTPNFDELIYALRQAWKAATHG